MAKFPSSGINIPGYLNTCNSPSSTGYQDAVGNPFFMGLTPGKIVTLGPNEVAQFTAPGTSLFDGAYQWVQLDSGATSANAVQGCAAFFLLDSGGASEGAEPETAYGVPTVTTADIAATLYGSVAVANAFFCGTFLNPATFNGQANTVTPGNWTMIFAGAGRTNALVGSVHPVVLGGPVFPDTNAVGAFQGAASGTTLPTTPGAVGVGATPGASTQLAVAYYKDLIYRIPF